MDSRLWHERLRGDLRRQGLPLSYIDRLVEELADHLVDSQTENPSMEAQQAYAQLGTTQQLAAAASHEFDRRSFAGRHPVLTFVVGPVVLAPALFVFCMLLVFGVAWAIGSAMELVASDALSQMPEQTKTHLEHGILWCYNLYARFLPFALAAWLFCRLGRRCTMPRWSLVACCIIALIAALVFTKATPATANSTGLYIVGLTLRPTIRQLLQLLPPLAIAGWFFFRPAATFLPRIRHNARLIASDGSGCTTI